MASFEVPEPTNMMAPGHPRSGSEHYDFPSLISYPYVGNDPREGYTGGGGGGGLDSTAGHHHRVRTWSGAAGPAFYAAAPGGPTQGGYSMPLGVAGARYGSAPILYPPQQQQQQQQQHQQQPQQLPPSHQYAAPRRKRKAGGTHRRVHSDNMSFAAASYGSMDPRSMSPKADFSPKTEFMKLTGNFRSLSPARSHCSNSPTPPWSTLVAPPSPHSSIRAAGNGVYGMNTEDMARLGYLTLSTRGGGGNNLGGEAIFATQKRGGGGKHKRAHSNGRMHMRQKSAQLFMQEVKGQEQTPSCRDIIFLMLFVFHLLGIVYLGNTYGYETVTLRNGTDDDSPFTIIYENLVFLSLISGVFGIIISGVMLFLMIAVAKRIVQIALFLSIGLSFLWGTMGIGLSPHKVVPATGIIALALTVAYTIVVWERCKFHGANLYASLTGIRANPGALMVAFTFQFLALVWSIYFTYVAVGVYDAVETGKIALHSQTAQTLIFAALAGSYCWSLQVFLVSYYMSATSVDKSRSHLTFLIIQYRILYKSQWRV